MIVLGIDQSLTSTGWCVLENDQLTDYGLISSDKSKENYERAIDVSNEIQSLEIQLQPDLVVIEGIPFMSRSNVTRDLAGLQFLILDRLLGGVTKEDIRIIPPTKLKKFATGNGKASKDDMFEALPDYAKEKISKTLKTKGRYDLTDAYWLARIGDKE